MLSCCCHQVLKNVMERTSKASGSRVSWTVRRCSNNECFRTFHDRNRSAAINILYLFLCQVYGKGIPALFEKGISRVGTGRSVWPWPWDRPTQLWPQAMLQPGNATPDIVPAPVPVPAPVSVSVQTPSTYWPRAIQLLLVPVPVPETETETAEGGEAMNV